MDSKQEKLTYRNAGVDIDAGEKAVDLIKEMARSTFNSRVISDIGGFGGLYSIAGMGMSDPVLVSGTDGVGTKLKVAFMSGIHNTVGIDAVAMCVNDVLCTGAIPLFFLDYLAVGKLEPEQARDIISGIAEGCRRGGCALIGGEMAEMPGFYSEGEYDIAGFCVGIVDRSKILDGSKVQKGDVVVGILSSGLHSNGYSLARKVFFDAAGLTPDSVIPELGGMKVSEVLLEPTRIYSPQVKILTDEVFEARAIAHITGGGLEGNLSRVIPEGCSLDIDWGSWPEPAVFKYMKNAGNIDDEEMRKVFNCGIGLAVVVPETQAEKVCEAIGTEEAFVIGRIV